MIYTGSKSEAVEGKHVKVGEVEWHHGKHGASAYDGRLETGLPVEPGEETLVME